MAVICGAVIAAALFTPVPATADVIQRPWRQAIVATDATAPPITAPRIPAPPIPARDTVALSLISTGMIGIGLSVGGLVIVTHRRKQW